MNTAKRFDKASWRQGGDDMLWTANGCDVVTHTGRLVATATIPEAARLLASAPRLKACLSGLFDHHENKDWCAVDIARANYHFWEDVLDTLANADPDRYGPEARDAKAAERAEREEQERARLARIEEAERMHPPKRTRAKVERELSAVRLALSLAERRLAELKAELAAWPMEA